MTKEIKAKEIKTDETELFFEGEKFSIYTGEEKQSTLGGARLHFSNSYIIIGFNAGDWKEIKKDILKLADKIKSDNRGDLPDLFKNIK